MPTELKKIVVYLRVSTEGQNFASQEDAVLSYCDARNWPRGDLSILREKISGMKKTRPVLDSVIGAAREGKIRTVVVYKLDRLGRSVTHLAWVINEFRKMGVGLICTSQNIDTSSESPSGNFQVSIIAAVAELEGEMIRERVKRGVASARKAGKVLGRPNIRDQHAPQALVLRKKGKTFLEIGKILGISETTAYRLARKAEGAKPIRKAPKVTKPRKFRLSKSSPGKQGSLSL
jgi:putative DNA-invertase from lambdoid prophage Rac